MAVIIILFVHVILCILFTYIKRKNKNLKNENILPIVYAVPFFGALCLLILIIKEKKGDLGQQDFMHEQSSIMQALYKRIEVEEDMDMQVVPLEEAILINDSKVRHSLMINILHKNPNEYINILKRASSSDDTEVTHYASTMMMEIMTEYEKNLQQYEKKHKNHELDDEELREYILYLDEFIKSGLVSGNIQLLYEKRLLEIIEEYLKNHENAGKILFISIEICLNTGENEKAYSMLEKAIKKYPNDERLYRLLGHYYDKTNNMDAMKKMIEKIKSENIYLSQSGREWLEFWS